MRTATEFGRRERRRGPMLALLLVGTLLAARAAEGAAIPGFSAELLETPPDVFGGPQARSPFNDLFYSDENGSIGRIRSDGKIAATLVPADSSATPVPSGIAFGPDGALWFLVGRTLDGVEETRMARWAAAN